jgi:predicted RecA/RadA family phage recombinase
MKNYVNNGETVTLAAPDAVSSGGGVLVGTLFGVAQADAAADAPVVLVTRGTFDLAKAASQAWTVGVAIHWDNTAKACTTTASGNTLIGKAVAAVGGGAGETIGRVRLNG